MRSPTNSGGAPLRMPPLRLAAEIVVVGALSARSAVAVAVALCDERAAEAARWRRSNSACCAGGRRGGDGCGGSVKADGGERGGEA